MDAPKAIVLIAPSDYAQVDAMVSGWLPDGMDVAMLDVYGLPGFAFWDDNEVNEVVQFMLDNFIDFRIYKDDTPYVAVYPPAAPPASPALPASPAEPASPASPAESGGVSVSQ